MCLPVTIIITVFGNLSYGYPGGDIQPNTGEIQIHQSSHVACTPSTKVIEADLSWNRTGALSISPSTANSRYGNLNNLQTTHIMSTCIDSHFVRHSHNDSISVTLFDGVVGADFIMGNASKLTRNYMPDLSAASLFSPQALEDVLTRYFRQCAAIVAKNYMMNHVSKPLKGSLTGQYKRIVVQSSTAQSMAVLVGLCAVFTTILIFLVPDYGILPCNPTTPLGIASLVAHSSGLLGLFRSIEDSDRARFNHLLSLWEFKSNVTPSSLPRLAYYNIQQREAQPNIDEKHRTPVTTPTPTVTPPLLLRFPIRLCLCFVLVGLILALEFFGRWSGSEDGGFSIAEDKTTGHHYMWTTLPALLVS